jgi:hypothetical protein
MQKFNPWLNLAVGALAGLFGGAIASIPLRSTAAEAQLNSAAGTVIRAKRVEIVDEKGAVQAWFGLSTGNGAGYNNGGIPAGGAALMVGRDDTDHVVVHDLAMDFDGPLGNDPYHALHEQIGHWSEVNGAAPTKKRWGINIYDGKGGPVKFSWVAP